MEKEESKGTFQLDFVRLISQRLDKFLLRDSLLSQLRLVNRSSDSIWNKSGEGKQRPLPPRGVRSMRQTASRGSAASFALPAVPAVPPRVAA
jgi:hypothetical protein